MAPLLGFGHHKSTILNIMPFSDSMLLYSTWQMLLLVIPLVGKRLSRIAAEEDRLIDAAKTELIDR